MSELQGCRNNEFDWFCLFQATFGSPIHCAGLVLHQQKHTNWTRKWCVGIPLCAEIFPWSNQCPSSFIQPIIVKDVAGLVPGAYQGRGKGNAFLNDLCDADVLIHVIDASGCSDKDGQVLADASG